MMPEADNKKTRKIILMGRSECGKTTLLQAIHKEELRYHKTQEIIHYDDAIDTPGEYIDQSGLWRACITAACDADIIVLAHDAGKRAVVGLGDIRALIDVYYMVYLKTEEEIEVARNFLKLSGARKIVETSAYTGQGIEELVELIQNIDLTDY